MTRIKIRRPEPVPTPEPLFRTVFNSKPKKITWGNVYADVLRVQVRIPSAQYPDFELEMGLDEKGNVIWINQVPRR